VYTLVATFAPELYPGIEEATMRITGVRELRANLSGALAGDEPILVTRHGKISGVYVPLSDPDRLPDDLRREFIGVIGDHLSRQLDAAGVTEEEVLEDFDAHRRRRRRC